ncbi:Hypothetical predicted protein [Lynx pardinus]|uniref:Uncharacterized protein n=1 Tax=Lynx pardinus TaxID=191816 RepID=A0A485P9V8_LYNPA|nr:Hypothetical predicted protein [Lynx pardinus]
MRTRRAQVEQKTHIAADRAGPSSSNESKAVVRFRSASAPLATVNGAHSPHVCAPSVVLSGPSASGTRRHEASTSSLDRFTTSRLSLCLRAV